MITNHLVGTEVFVELQATCVILGAHGDTEDGSARDRDVFTA